MQKAMKKYMNNELDLDDEDADILYNEKVTES